MYCPDPHIWAGKRRQDLDHLCCGVGRGRWLPGEQVRVWWRGGPASLAAGRNAEPPSRWFPPQTTPGVASPVAGAAAMRNEGRPVPSTTPVPVPRASSRRSLGWMPAGGGGKTNNRHQENRKQPRNVRQGTSHLGTEGANHSDLALVAHTTTRPALALTEGCSTHGKPLLSM